MPAVQIEVHFEVHYSLRAVKSAKIRGFSGEGARSTASRPPAARPSSASADFPTKLWNRRNFVPQRNKMYRKQQPVWNKKRTWRRDVPAPGSLFAVLKDRACLKIFNYTQSAGKSLIAGRIANFQTAPDRCLFSQSRHPRKISHLQMGRPVLT